MNTSTHWHVLGAGAIGGLWAMRLAAAGHRVTLLTHHAIHPTNTTSAANTTSATNTPTRTLTLQHGDKISTHTFPQENIHAAANIEYLLVTTKAHHSAAALTPLLKNIATNTPVLLLQNGLGVDDWLRAERPDIHIFTGISREGVYRRSTDFLIHAGDGSTLIGSAHDEKTAAALAQNLSSTHYRVQFSANIKKHRWQKLAINCLINPLTARYRCRNGELLKNQHALATMRALSAEIAAVMQAEGFFMHDFLSDDISIEIIAAKKITVGNSVEKNGAEKTNKQTTNNKKENTERTTSEKNALADFLFTQACAVAEKTSANTSSMLSDVLAARATEINFINGYLHKKAHEHGIQAPVNHALLHEILALPLA